MAIIQGTNNSETLTGTAGGDNISGYGGNDILNGLAGRDFLFGDADADWLYGDAGNDDLYGGHGNDRLFGGIDSDFLDGGYGEDILDGGDGDDFLFGGEDGSADRLDGGNGSDWFYSVQSNNSVDGGDGNDFFYLGNHNSMEGVRIDGGSGDDVLFLSISLDRLVIRNHLDGFGDRWTTLWAPGMEEALELRSVEKVVAADVHFDLPDRQAIVGEPFAITNVVFARDRSVAVDFQGAVIAEMARLADLAYEDVLGTSPPSGWHSLSALELGLPRESIFHDGVGAYTFDNGVFSVRTADAPLGLEAIGKAVVLIGELNGLATLTIAFRGTDFLLTDLFSWPDFTDNYEQFLPLIEAVKAFAADYGIKQIFLTGHSMGAALAQTALGESFSGSEWSHVRAIAFASPGGDIADAPGVPSDRIMTFNRFLDVVPQLSAPFKDTAGAIVEMSTANARELNPLTMPNHGPDLYAQDLVDLTRAVSDVHNAGFHATAFAAALREGRQWTGASVSIVVGNDAANSLSAYGQGYVVGGGGQDILVIEDVAANRSRLVDGGAAFDLVVINRSGPVSRTGAAEDFLLSGAGGAIGRFVGVEAYVANGFLHFSSGRTASIQRPTNAMQSVQTTLAAAATVPTFVVDPDFDAADAGDGALAVVGTASDDIIFAGLGDKTIQGHGGNDILIVRDGGASGQNDWITLDGGVGADVMSGGSGSERILVDDLGDIASGGGGIDTVEASVSYALPDDVENLTLTGGATAGAGNAQSNMIVGNALANTLSGEGGNDTLDGAAGADQMTGGLGNDLYLVGAGDTVIEKAGEGTDEVRTSLAAFSLAGLAHVENLTGTSAAGQTLTGNAASNRIDAGSGNDVLHLWTGGGNDNVNAGAGMDNIFFGATLTSADVVNGGAGVDTLVVQGPYGSLALTANITQIENLSILGGNNTSFGEPGTNRYDYVLTTHDSNFAAGVQARINGAALLEGEDFTFDGAAETDASFVVYGGKGKDTLVGGLGNDIFFYAEERFASGDTVNGGAGYDGMFLRGNYTIDFNAPGYTGLFTNIENLTLTSATDERYARGGGTEFDYNLTLSNAIVGAGQQLTVSGALLMATETMILDASQESNGSLRLFGGKAADTLKGGALADFLHGNSGADILAGGGGADVFRYQAVTESYSVARDHILDFTPGTDKIELDRIDARTNLGGDQAFTWIGSNAFSNTAGQLRAFQSGAQWIVEGDINGDGFADLIIALTLQGPTPLGAGDFLL